MFAVRRGMNQNLTGPRTSIHLTSISQMISVAMVVTCSCKQQPLDPLESGTVHSPTRIISLHSPASSESTTNDKSIGPDDNIEIRDAKQSALDRSRAVAAMFSTKHLNATADGRFATVPYHNDLCPRERFAGQPMLSTCTGFLIKDRSTLATAAHCFNKEDTLYAVFGYRLEEITASTSFAANEVCTVDVRVPSTPQSRPVDGTDWALLKLDCPLPLPSDVVPLSLAHHEPQQGEPLYVIHHPLGLPMKYADNGRMRDVLPGKTVSTSLDAMAGSSGAPVFSDINGELVGMIKASTYNGTSWASCRPCTCFREVPQGGPDHEIVTSVAAFMPFLR